MMYILVLMFLNPYVHGSQDGLQSVFPDENDYRVSPLCGDKPMFAMRTCYCGNRTLDGNGDLADGDYYCCVAPSPPGQEQCKYTSRGTDDPTLSDVRCDNGVVKKKSEPCHQYCWNPYRSSNQLWKTATFYCREEDRCLPLDEMCSGVCKDDAEVCVPDKMRCRGYGYDYFEFALDYTLKSLKTKLGKDHGYCLKVDNNQVYDSISREDEEKVLGTNQPTINYEGLVKSKCDPNPNEDWYGTDGIQCSNVISRDGCKTIEYWCTGSGDVCNTGYEIASLDNPSLCRNSTFWRQNNFSCEWYWGGLVVGIGSRCSARLQHCSWPWYRVYNAKPTRLSADFQITCVDKSDQVFPINTSCQKFNQQFLNVYKRIWCFGQQRKGTYCVNPGVLFSNQDNDKITDPHGCQKSCKTTTTAGADCVACEHPDFFHCNSTGFCINKDLVCDGHPHPMCGGDDEGIEHCLEDYFKKRIVKNYATLICRSKMYPEMDTLAVVCDDNIECAEDRDEAQCRTGTDKYDPVVYAMTAVAGMFYVILKLVWWFYLRHQPVGDEEDEEDMEMEELESTSNHDQRHWTTNLVLKNDLGSGNREKRI